MGLGGCGNRITATVTSNSVAFEAKRMNWQVRPAESENDPKWTQGASMSTSVQLDVARPDDLCPFLGFGRDESAELRRRCRHRHDAKGGEARLHFRIG